LRRVSRASSTANDRKVIARRAAVPIALIRNREQPLALIRGISHVAPRPSPKAASASPG
jgi:hypothetical protein